MGGGGFSRAYASGSNTKINQAALLKAAARAPKTVSSVIKDQFVPYSSDWKKDFTDPEGTTHKAGETVDRFNAAGDKVGFTMYRDKPIYDGYGNITSTSVAPKHVPYAANKVIKKAAADPDFNVADYYERMTTRADKAITPEATRKVLNSHDPNRGALMGTSPTGYLMDQQVGAPFIETIRSKQIPLTKKLDTPFELDYDYGYHSDKLYMKQPPLEGKLNLQQGFTDKEREEYRDLAKRGSFVDISGGTSRVGEYTMAWVEDPPEPSKWEKFLGNPVLSVLGAINPAIGLATTAAKATSGMKVSPMEIAGGLFTGLKIAGVITPPSLTAMPAGQVGTPLPTAGTGLFGSTYAQTQTALNVAAAGDAKGAALALVGDNLIKGGLDGIGLDQAAIEGAGIQYDDFQAGVGKTVQKLAEGEELDDALAHGLGKYIREGGTLGSIDLPSVDLGIDLGGIEDLAKDLVRPIGKVATAVAHLVEDGAQAIGDATRPIIKAIEEPLKPVGNVIEDVGQAAGDVIEDVGQLTGDVVEDVAQGVGDVLSDLDTAIRQALPDIDLPDIDLPDVNLPDVNLPRFNLDLGGLLTSVIQAVPQPAANRTTDSLFKDELFQFQTEIGADVEPIEYVDLGFSDPFQEQTLTQRYPF